MNILISACLVGRCCRYDGKNKNAVDISELEKHHKLYPICPETDGGLSVPREPAEIIGERVINRKGVDVTEEYTRGALHALEVARENSCTAAILKARSPSCGKGKIYDGSFSGTLTDGNGITADLLMRYGIRVYTEDETDMLIEG